MLLLTPALVLLASLLVASAPSPAPQPKAAVWDVSAIEGHMLATQLTWCKANIKGDYKTECTYKFWKQFAPLFGPVESFRAVTRERAAHPDFIPECHHAMHAIGQAAFTEYGSFAALRLSDSTCQGGYVHGVIQEWTLAYTGEEQVATVCEPTKGIDGNDRTYSMCGHGLGHAVALRYPSSMTEAILVCERDASEALRSACVTGAVMEFAGGDHVTLGLQAELASSPKDHVKPSDYISGCNALKLPDTRHACWSWQHMLVPDVEKENPSTYAKSCAGATDPSDFSVCVSRWAEYATYHIGITSLRDPDIARKATKGFEGCAALSSDQEIVTNCQARLVENLWRDEPLASSQKSFCPDMPERFRPACLAGEKQAETTRLAA